MNDCNKLNMIMTLLETELQDIHRCIDQAGRYTTLSGHTIDCVDAVLTLEPIVEKIRKIYADDK